MSAKRTPGPWRSEEANKVEADAKLIAAAPELADALEELIRFGHAGGCRLDRPCVSCVKATAALRKAGRLP